MWHGATHLAGFFETLFNLCSPKSRGGPPIKSPATCDEIIDLMLTMNSRTIQYSERSASLKRLLGCLALGFLALAHPAQGQDESTARDDQPSGKRILLPRQVDEINQAIEASWKENELRPSPIEDELKWCRRVYLDILGRIPAYEELAAFAKDRSPDKRYLLVNRLLNDDKYVPEYAQNWSTIWTNILIGRNGGMEDRSLINREGMQKYLRDAFATNKPYNKMVHELVTATGTTRPGVEGFNGATNFLAMKVNDEKGVQATAAVSRIFLGRQVQCAQCHDHPFNDWKQQKFWEFNSFFRQSRALRRYAGGRDIDHVELVNEDFPGEGRYPEKAEIYFQDRRSMTGVAYPVFLDGTSIGPSGYVSQVNRREELAKFMENSEYLDQAIVNRMWAHFLGYGFTKPIDDLGPHNPPMHPELLASLGEDFRKKSYDLKQLIVWITMSKPYQLSSRTTKENASDDPTQGERPEFSHFYTRQMSPEQLYQSLTVATQAGRRGNLEEQQRRRDEWLKQFVVAFGTDEGDETTTFNGSIPQTLMLFNGDLIRDAISTEPGAWLHQLSQNKSPPQEKVQLLFIAGLGRKAKPEEMAIATQLMEARKRDIGGMLQDMWWAILNSNEFIFIH
jgi:hypothetical protein